MDPAKYVVGPDAVVTDDDVDLDQDPITLPSGRVIDNKGAEALVEETLAAAQKRGLLPGRKSLSGGRHHSPVVAVRLPDAVRDKLVNRAKAEGRSVSAVIREGVERYLAS